MFQAEKFLIDTVDVYRSVYSADKFGGSQGERKLVASDVSCRIHTKSGAKHVDEAGREYRPTHKLLATYDVNLEADDKVTDQNDVTYQILSRSRRRIGERASHTECSLIQVAG